MGKILTILLVIAAATAFSQEKYYTKSGKITFLSKAPLENIEAINQKVTAVIDTKTGAVEFAVLMKAFEFEKALMQEHFNENYVESDKFPKATFKGTIENISAVNFAKAGAYPIHVKGILTIHGKSKQISTRATIKTGGAKPEATSTFTVQLSDYNIKIPSVVKDKISNNIAVTVSLFLEPLTKK